MTKRNYQKKYGAKLPLIRRETAENGSMAYPEGAIKVGKENSSFLVPVAEKPLLELMEVYERYDLQDTLEYQAFLKQMKVIMEEADDLGTNIPVPSVCVLLGSAQSRSAGVLTHVG